MKMRWTLLAAAVLAVSLAGCLAVKERLEQEIEEEGEKSRKSWSGRSWLKETVVAAAPAASSQGAGFDAERAWSGYDDWEPAIGVDPGGRYVYQMTTRYGGPKACTRCADPALIFRRSQDGGATWDPDQFLVLTGGAQNDPEIEVAANGVIYAAFMHNYRPGIKVMRSSDQGETWTDPIPVLRGNGVPTWGDKPLLAVSPTGQDVYIAFNASSSYIAASHDAGLSFAPPVRTSHDQRYWFHGGGAVAPDGTVYFTASDFSQEYTGDTGIHVIRSTDGGRSWRTIRLDTSSEMADCPWAEGCYFGFLAPQAAVAVDPAGQVMVAYNAGDTPGGAQRMFVRTSSDRGESWSERIEVSSGREGVHNAFPAVAAGREAGDFRVAFMDDREQPTAAWNVWYRRTGDTGRSWSEAVRVSDQAAGAPYKGADGFAFPYGDYFEMGVDDQGRAHLIWGEGSSYNGPGGTWYTRER